MDKKERSKFAALVAGLKESLSKKQDELDKAGVERKALTPEIVEGLRDGLVSIVPDIDEEATTAIMQLIVEVLSEEMGESDVEEEIAALNEDDDEKENKQVVDLVAQVTEMSKEHNQLVKDISEVVQLNIKSAERMNADKKEFIGLAIRLEAMEKQLKQKPRRASQAPETTLDPESELSKALTGREFTPPPAFADLFENGGAS